MRRTFGIPSGTGDFLTLIELSAPCTARTVENRSSGMMSTLIRDTSAEVSGETNEKVVLIIIIIIIIIIITIIRSRNRLL